MSFKQVRSHIIGDFITKVLAATEEGFVFSEHEVYKLGREYIADLRKPVVTATFEIDAPINTDSDVEGETITEESLVEVAEGEPEEVSATTVPDWELLDKLVTEGDKDAIETYCKGFGIDLSKRKTPANMLTDFKEFVGA